MNAPKPTSGDDAALSNLMGAALGTPETSRPAGAQNTKPAAPPSYGSPAEVAQRIEQYIAHYGRENTAGLLLYEAMKALRAPAPAAGDAPFRTTGQPSKRH
jgi:hypothetical protein